MKWHKTKEILPARSSWILLYDRFNSEFMVAKYDVEVRAWVFSNSKVNSVRGFALWTYLEKPDYGQ